MTKTRANKHSLDDIRSGLRIAEFEKRLTIAFIVSNTNVTILRIFYGGQNWENEFDTTTP